MAALPSQVLGIAGVTDAQFLAAADTMAHGGLFATQERAIAETGILRGNSVCVIGPPGMGKSALADLAAIRTVAGGKSAMYLFPTRVLLRERAFTLRKIFQGLPVRIVAVGADDGDGEEQIFGGTVDIILAVYEKAFRFVSKCPALFQSVGLVVADEMQTASDPQRGNAIMVFLAAWREHRERVQIVGLSSYRSRVSSLAKSIGLQVWQTEERPCAARVGIVDTITRKIHVGGEEETDLRGDFDESLEAALPAFFTNFEKPILAFVATRSEAKRMAVYAASLSVAEESTQDIQRLLADRRAAFYSSDLTIAEKAVVQDRLAAGQIDLCVSTIGLGEGLNFPVRTVLVFPSPFPMCGEHLQGLLGRACRPGQEGSVAYVVRNSAAPPRASVSPRRSEPAIAEAAFALVLGAGDRAIGMRIFNAAFDGLAAFETLFEFGVRSLYWSDEGALTQLGEFVAEGVPPSLLQGWQSLLRRFDAPVTDAARTFGAVAFADVTRAIPLSEQERAAGALVEKFREMLAEETSPIGEYYNRFLANPRTIPRDVHRAVKCAVVLAEAHTKSAGDIEREYGISAGMLEDLTLGCRQRVAQFSRLAKSLGRDTVSAPVAPRKTQTAPVEFRAAEVEQGGVRLVIQRASTGIVFFDGREVLLTPIQYRLLEFLARHAGEGMPYERVQRNVWTDAIVERQQISFHRRRLEERLLGAIAEGGSLIETHARWGIRLRLAREQVRFEGDGAMILRGGARVIDLNSIAREVG